MDAALVRAFIAATDERPADAAGVERIRAALEILGRPDIRYLVATIRGPGAAVIARYARSILEVAGAATGGPSDPIGDELLAAAGTEIASAMYSLGASRPELGEMSREELSLLLGLAALAARSRRVALLADEGPLGAASLVDAVTADVLVLSGTGPALLDALRNAPRDRPVVIVDAETDGDAAGREAIAVERGLSLLRSGREFSWAVGGTGLAVTVAGETYAGLAPAPRDEPAEVAAGVTTALAIALLGVRMRPDWVERGVSRGAAE